MKSGIILLACSISFVFFPKLGAFAQTEAQPLLFSQKDFNTAVLADAVNHFVELGEEAAVEQLKQIISKDYVSGKIDKTFRVACVARILWANGEVPIRAPRLGMYGGGISFDQNNEQELKKWPKYPVAKSGNSFFVVVHSGRVGTGRGPNGGAKEYIDHCKTNGTFLATAIPIPSSEESRNDLETLLKSERWRNARGNDERTIESLRAQLPSSAK